MRSLFRKFVLVNYDHFFTFPKWSLSRPSTQAILDGRKREMNPLFHRIGEFVLKPRRAFFLHHWSGRRGGLNFHFNHPKLLVKVKLILHTNLVAHQARANPFFSGMKPVGVFLLPLNGILVHRKCIAQEHDTMHAGVWRFNYQATAPPHCWASEFKFG